MEDDDEEGVDGDDGKASAKVVDGSLLPRRKRFQSRIVRIIVLFVMVVRCNFSLIWTMDDGILDIMERRLKVRSVIGANGTGMNQK